jgi:hypothetical protein
MNAWAICGAQATLGDGKLEVLDAVAVESIFSVRVLRITSGTQRSMYVLLGYSRPKRKVLTTIEAGTSISDI